MPIFKIDISCQLDGVTNLEAPGDGFQYQIKLRCNNCAEVFEKWQYVSADEKYEIPGSRGTCNYMAKCKLCNRHGNLDVCQTMRAKYTSSDVPKLKTIVGFECRGLSVCDFRFGEGWCCVGAESGTKFAEIDLSDDWCEYDEEQNAPVGISELKFKIN